MVFELEISLINFLILPPLNSNSSSATGSWCPGEEQKRTQRTYKPTRDGVAQDRERSLEAHKEDSKAQQIHLESDGQMPTFHQDTEAGLCLDG